MRDKKKSEPAKTPEQEALERHVDAMMDPKLPDASSPEPATANTGSEPKIEAVATPVADPPAASTAPQLSSKLRKQITVSDAAAKPLQIDKLDELADQITRSEGKKTPKKSAKKTGKAVPPAPQAEPEAPEKSEAQETQEEPSEPDKAPTQEDAQQDDIPDKTILDDARTDDAVDEISAYESDVMLAVADSTAEEHNREVGATQASHGHPVISMLGWTLVALVVILIIAVCVLLVMGDSVASKFGSLG